MNPLDLRLLEAKVAFTRKGLMSFQVIRFVINRIKRAHHATFGLSPQSG